MDSFDSFCFPSLDHASERCVDEQQTAFVDSLLLPYVQSPRQTMPMTMAAPSINATQNCDNTSNLWLQQPHGQSYPQSSYPKEEANVSMSAMYSMLMNRIPARAANQTGSMNNLNATDIVPIALSAAVPAPATIMNLLSMTNSSSSALAASNSSASMKREDSNNSMSELDHEYDTASTVSPFSTSDGSLSSDEYPTPSVSPLAQSHPAAHFQAQIKLEANAAIVHHAHQGLHAQAHGHAQGGDDEFSIEIIAPPSNVLEGRRVNGNHSATSDVNASANATSNDSTSAPVKKRASQKKRTLNGKAEMQLSAVSGPNRKNAKRPAKRSYESSDDSDSEEELDDDAKHSKGSSASSSCSASGVDSKTRLARKAELARMSRRRKKMRLNDLEKEVKRLHEELAMLQNEAKAKQINTTMQQQIQTQADSQENETPNTTNSSMSAASTPIASSAPLPSASVSDEAEYAQLMSLMNDFVNGAKSVDSSAGADGAQRAESLLDLFVSGHASFLRSGSMHLNALNQHVQSILPFQFLNWMCTQGDAFYQDPSGLWRSLLVDELHLKADQLNDMDTFRHTVRKQYKHVVEIQKLFKRMSEAMEKQSAFSLQNMERIRTVLTPNQFAHFIDWVQKFGEICLKMHQ